jgi:alpha-mannosidase
MRKQRVSESLYRRVQNPLPQLIPLRVERVRAQVDALVWSRREVLPVRGGPVIDGIVPVEQGRQGPLVDVEPGAHFGPAHGGWQTRWFRVDVPEPQPEEAGRRHLAWLCDGETVAHIADVPWAGLDAAHETCPLPDEATTLWLECGLWQSMSPFGRPRVIGPYGARFDGCELRVRDERAWGVSHDLDVLFQLVALLYHADGIVMPADATYLPPLEMVSPLLRALLRRLEEACDGWVAEGLPGLEAGLARTFERLPAEAWQPVAALCGHAHLDLVWLWPERVSRRKAVHSCATVLRLMERYPELTFLQSQPAVTRMLAEEAPAMLPDIARRVAEGRWELTGAFEVEPDTNVPSGEALARSLAVGQRKLAALRGTPSDTCWLPDVFGYSTALPQILRLGGVRHFFTTKMTWSAITRFPYTSFVWRGADGSEVLAHLSTTNYNGSVALAALANALRAHRQAGLHPEMLLPTGWGDGGGGPSEMMCERARRIGNLAGVPVARWTTSAAFFERLEPLREQLPVYQGELYLEYHRGTLTTQAEFKRLYRAAETALQAHEAARVATGVGPLDDAAWLRVLFCQFHDALPGSSIREVYEDLNPELAGIVTRELAAASAALATTGAGATAFNPLPVPRTVVLGGSTAGDEPILVRLDPLAGGPLDAGVAVNAPVHTISPTTLDNGLLRATFDERGQLTGLRVGDEELTLDAPCGFRLYHDDPAHFDAWDIDHYTFGTGVAVAAEITLEVVERGPLRGVLRGQARIGERSTLAVTWSLEAESRHLRLDVDVDWQETHRLLKFHAPTGYRGRMARFGAPFGAIDRPQQPGIEADEARWEVAGSRWAAVMRDDGTGLALLAEAKYGYSCRDGDLGVSLLRAPTWPDASADSGRHHIRLALGRYEPRMRGDILCTAASADALFAPVIIAPGARVLPPPFAWEELGSLTPSWVLPSGGGGFIVRLHETAGGSGVARLRLSTPAAAWLVDFLERPLGDVDVTGDGALAIPYGPYQVVSVLVEAGTRTGTKPSPGR